MRLQQGILYDGLEFDNLSGDPCVNAVEVRQLDNK